MRPKAATGLGHMTFTSSKGRAFCTICQYLAKACWCYTQRPVERPSQDLLGPAHCPWQVWPVRTQTPGQWCLWQVKTGIRQKLPVRSAGKVRTELPTSGKNIRNGRHRAWAVGRRVLEPETRHVHGWDTEQPTRGRAGRSHGNRQLPGAAGPVDRAAAVPGSEETPGVRNAPFPELFPSTTWKP